MADHPLAYWPLQTNPGSAEFKPTAGGPLPPPASTTVAPANPIATRYLGNPAAGDERFEAIVRDWPNDRYAVEFWFRNDRPVDQDLVTGYLVSRGGEDPNHQQVDFGEHLGIGGMHNSGVGQRGRLFVFNGDDRPEGSLVGKQALDVGRWYHVVMQRNQESVQVFLNGQTAQPEISGKLACHVTLPQFFGATRSDNMFPLHGQIRHVALYAEPLPLPRIEAHFQAAIDKSAKAPA
ncbi:MAG: LamG-like jellyroll fold domain-containing protein [Pirellulales bacterium]